MLRGADRGSGVPCRLNRLHVVRVGTATARCEANSTLLFPTARAPAIQSFDLQTKQRVLTLSLPVAQQTQPSAAKSQPTNRLLGEDGWSCTLSNMSSMSMLPDLTPRDVSDPPERTNQKDANSNSLSC